MFNLLEKCRIESSNKFWNVQNLENSLKVFLISDRLLILSISVKSYNNFHMLIKLLSRRFFRFKILYIVKY